MKKSIASFLILLSSIFFTSHAQNASTLSKPDYMGTFCLVTQTSLDTNFFRIDLSQLSTEFSKIYFKNYYLEQDYFHTKIKTYNISAGEAIIAVPIKYAVNDFRHFVGNLKKMTDTFNSMYSDAQKIDYIDNHPENN